jgi:hypothetical protein
MERRRHARLSRYFPVRFGAGERIFEGRTSDVSIGGLFVSSRDLLAPGTRLWLELLVEPERPLHLEGRVVRHLPALPARRREGGFAVRLLAPAEALAPYFPPDRARELELPPVSWRTKDALDRAAGHGLFDGQLFVWAKEPRDVGDRVRVRLGLLGHELDARGAVTQVVEDQGRVGLALVLDDVDGLRAAVAQALESAS